MTELAYYRDNTTGKVAQYPDAYAALFPNLFEVTQEEAECVTCWAKDPEAGLYLPSEVVADEPVAPKPTPRPAKGK